MRTIGYGNTSYMRIYPDTKAITVDIAEKLFMEDVRNSTSVIERYYKDAAKLIPCQLAALVSLVFNIGSKAFRNTDGTETHLLKALKSNPNQHEEIERSWLLFNKVNGKISKTHVNRRKREIELYKGNII